MASTRSVGNKGEKIARNLFRQMGATIIRTNDDDRYDFKTRFPEEEKIFSVEVKGEPKAITKYKGFSVEIGHRRDSYILSYIVKSPFNWDGIPTVPTGLSTTKSDFYVFNDTKKQQYIVKTEALKKWFNDVYENEKHRIRWGGFNQHTLQVQIRLDELEQIGSYFDERKKRGRKPKNK